MLSKITVLLLWIVSPLAHADWQADVATKFSNRDIPAMNGKMKVKKDSVRIDMSQPMEISVIVNRKQKKAFTLMHPAKIVMDADLSQYDQQIPLCSATAAESCYPKIGLKKTGTEKIDGKDCAIYEGNVKGRKKDGSEDVAMKIWHPNGSTESPPLKSIATMKNGDTVESRFTNIVVKSLPDSTFSVPKGYQRAGAMEDLMKSFKGFGGE